MQNTSCIRKPQIVSAGGAHPLYPPPRSAPALGAFLSGDLDHDQWSKISHAVHQRNQWIRDQRGFISSIYEPWWILIQLTPKKCTLYLYWTLLNKTSWPDKIVNLIGLKIISNVNKHYSAYDSLKYFLTVFWYCYASVFFPKFFHLQPHSHLPQLNFSVFLYWKYNIVILYMHTLSKISHPFKPNQAPNVATSVCYIISCMSQPLRKVLCSCTGTQSAKHIHVKCFPGVNFTSLIPGQTQNSIPLGYVNKILTEYIRPL